MHKTLFSKRSKNNLHKLSVISEIRGVVRPVKISRFWMISLYITWRLANTCYHSSKNFSLLNSSAILYFSVLFLLLSPFRVSWVNAVTLISLFTSSISSPDILILIFWVLSSAIRFKYFCSLSLKLLFVFQVFFFCSTFNAFLVSFFRLKRLLLFYPSDLFWLLENLVCPANGTHRDLVLVPQ